MAKLTLADVSNILGNPTSAANTINANNTLIEAALENTLSRDGTTPNQMLADFDMNSNDILNVDNVHANVIVLGGEVLIPGEVVSSQIATQAEAEAGVNDVKIMTPLKTKQAVTNYGLLKANNLSELIPTVSTARANLGLGNSATRNVGTTVGTVAAGDDARIVNALQPGSSDENLNFLQSGSGAVTRTTRSKLRDILNVVDFGAVGDGVTPAQTAFGLAATAATANITTTAAYASMPQTPTAQVIVPAGVWHLTADVVVAGKQITWIVEEGARFTSGSAARLLGKVVRPSRNSNSFPFGFLDAATGDSVMIGQGSSDNSPLVSGFTNPNAISTVDTIDLVGRYTDVTSTAVLHTSTATFTATTCTLATPIDTNKLRIGMVVQTLNVPYERGQVTSWNGAGTIITCSNGWYAQGSTTASTPAAGSVIFNPFHKVWGLNTNTFLLSASYGFQSTGHEVGVWNDKVTPTIAEDSSGRTWGEDVVNLGPRKGSMAFLARGSFFEAYRATGTDIGFKSSAYPSLGYAKPAVGFEHEGGGVSYRARNASGIIDFEVNNGLVELGPKGASGNAIIDFNVGAIAADYDCRLIASGGDGTIGNGSMFSDSLITFTKHCRPITDNAYQLGGASNRWTVVFATTGTINTSDERLKRFLDAYDQAENTRIMASAVRAVKKLPVRLYQWNDSLEEKGDKARLHFGVSAQDVEKVFASEGLDARSFGLFCEDEDTDEIEVVSYVDVPENEEVEEEQTVTEITGGKMVVFKKLIKVQKAKTAKVPMVYEDGSPVMKEVGLTDADGNPVWYMGKLMTTKEPAFAEVPVMRKKEVKTYERVPNGKTRLGLRYDQLLLLYIKALEV